MVMSHKIMKNVPEDTLKGNPENFRKKALDFEHRPHSLFLFRQGVYCNSDGTTLAVVSSLCTSAWFLSTNYHQQQKPI
jgi:hypothetical protein